MAKKPDPMDEVDFEEDSDYVVSKTPRWLAVGVLSVAVFGFVGLAYYAYHAGTRSIKDDELLLVQADSAPIKEKPADPGGMKFPNQDKTIFDAVSGNAKSASAERVMPAPEQPIQRDQASSEEVKAWVNEKLEKDAPASKELAAKPSALDAKLADASANLAPAAGDDEAPAPSAEKAEEKPAVKAEEKAPVSSVEKAMEKAKEPSADDKKVELKKPAPVPEKPAKKAESAKPAKHETTEAKPAKKTAAGGGFAQLGAYRSEAEAKAAWKKIQASVGGGSPDIQKADLGAKGVFYRLRVATGDAKALCQKLSAKGQPCIVVK